jgi:hypothetical protein
MAAQDCLRFFIRRQTTAGFDDKAEIQVVGFGRSKQTFS